MRTQNYKNHVRYYLPHHLFFYLCNGAILTIGIIGLVHRKHHMIWIAITALAFLTGWLSFMMRQHYALTCQNRIVRLELRFRYFVLTGQRLDKLEDQLSFNQLAALRFASDDELETLVNRAINERLSPDDIKKSIVNWLPDHMRV
jgi:hypothetical protein